eukprot:gene22532-34480_t
MTRLRALVANQCSVIAAFLADPLYRGAVSMAWLQAFGGALHGAVTTFFYLKLGATEMDIGTYVFISASGGLLSAPVQGWYQDAKGSYPVLMIAGFLCALGCFVRGYAVTLLWVMIGEVIMGFGGTNVEMLTLAHVVKSTPPHLRTLYVSGFLVQISAFRILAAALFPLIDAGFRFLGLQNDLLRYRSHMTFCIVFCFIGNYILYRSKQAMQTAHQSHKDCYGQNRESPAPLVVPSHRGTPILRHARPPKKQQTSGLPFQSGDCGTTGSLDATTPDTVVLLPPAVESELDVDALSVAVHPDHRLDHTTLVSFSPNTRVAPDSDTGRVSCRSAACDTNWSLVSEPAENESKAAEHRTASVAWSREATQFLALSFVMASQMYSLVVVYMLWPLFLKDQFSWTAVDYGYVLLSCGILTTISVSLAPILDDMFGPVATGVALCMTSGIAATISFTTPLWNTSRGIQLAAHIGFASVSLFCITGVDPVIKVFVSLLAPHSVQARAFGGLATAAGSGAMLASLVGAYLYKFAAGRPLYLAVPMIPVLCVMVLSSGIFLWLSPAAKQCDRTKRAPST